MAFNSPNGSYEGSPDTKMEDTGNELAEPTSEKSPRFGNLGFLKGLTEKKTTRDGQAPKRRGPKPDSKPAMTRRQELNRQAQRTHRERKEIYMKSLEEELVRTKVAYNNTLQERNAIADENRELKELLISHGIIYSPVFRSDFVLGRTTTTANTAKASARSLGQRSNHSSDHVNGHALSATTSRAHSIGQITSTYAGSLASVSGTQVNNLSPDPTPGSNSSLPLSSGRKNSRSELSRSPHTVYHSNGMDHDQLGVDFVLALEKVCHDHQQFMCVRAEGSETEVSGHAMMMSCPPPDHIQNKPDETYPHKPPELPVADLMQLYNLSQKLPLGGEITPVQALQIIRSHERYQELTTGDFELLKNDLKEKSRCYGFGAVLEEFEVQDALQNVFATKYGGFTFE